MNDSQQPRPEHSAGRHPRRSRRDTPGSNRPQSGTPHSQQRRGGGRRSSAVGRGRTATKRPPKKITRAPRTLESATRKGVQIPALAEGNIRIIPISGVEEIGRNMTIVEIGDDIIVLDAGIQFSDPDTPGVDYILPNTQYLEERREKIRGLVVTHGHLDHIGGIPYVIDRIGNPPIYTRRLTGAMIKKRNEEFAYLPEPDIREVETDKPVQLGNLRLRFFAVTHTVPDSMGIIIETPYGDIVCTGDIKLDHENGVPTKEEQEEYAIFKDRNVLFLMMDSTNTWQPGWSIPEANVYKTLEKIVAETPGRLIVGMFASHLERLIRIIQYAEKTGRKVAIDGRSMKTNTEIARQLALLKHKDDTMISVEQINDYPPEKILILATGAQGDEFASLMRIGNKTHRHIRLQPTDTVVLSSSVIPGNERAVQKLKDNISRQGAHIITYHASDVHASGHGNYEEAKWIHQQIKPKFFMPQHGYHYMLRVHADLAQSLGLPKENIVIPDNGSLIEIQENGTKLVKLKQTAPSVYRVIEGQSMGELSDVLIRDRKALAQEGFCVVVATVDKRTGRLHKSPDIISRGFVYLRENKDLMDQTRLIVRKAVEDALKGNKRSLDDAREDLAASVAKFLLQQTQKNPIVIPVIVSI